MTPEYPGPGEGTPEAPWTPGIDPSLGPNDYFGPTLISVDQYFDPQATSDSWPGKQGLNMKSLHWTQNGEYWDTYEEVGPGAATIDTGNPDPTAPADDSGVPPGGTPGSGPYGSVGPSINGIPLTWCEEDGIIGDLYGAQSNTIQILLQGVQDIGDFWFPVNPEELSATFDNDNDYEVDAIGVGEIIIPGTERLESVGWSSFLPLNYDDGYVSIPSGLLYEPDYAMQKLIETKRNRLICFLTIGGTPWNDFVVIKSLKWSAHAGEVGDIFYDIEFKRYRDVTIQTVDIPGAGVTDPRDAPSSSRSQATTPNSDNPNGSDSTQPQEQQVNAAPTDAASVAVAPVTVSPQDALNRLGGGFSDDRIVQDTYTVMRPGMAITDVFDDLKRQGQGDYNSIEKLMSDNANNPVSYPSFLGITPGVPDSFVKTHTKVSDFSQTDAFPLGTKFWYMKRLKLVSPPVGAGIGRTTPLPQVVEQRPNSGASQGGAAGGGGF